MQSKEAKKMIDEINALFKPKEKACPLCGSDGCVAVERKVKMG